jgi:hypothetical protein
MTTASSIPTTKPKLIVADPTKGIKVDASSIAEPFRNEIKRTVQLWKEQGIGTSCCLLVASLDVEFSTPHRSKVLTLSRFEYHAPKL